MTESRLSIVIDSRTAEQKAQDVKRALQALEDAGVRVTGATEAASSAMSGQAQQSQRLVTSLNSARGAMGRMQQAQAGIKAGQKGLFQPVQAQQYAQSVNRAAQSTDGVAQSYRRAGLSAKQLQQAQRQLPMQFTDIFVSLASGQPAMQVFLQQGGQLKDVFGGVGPALRGMAGYVASLINPMTIAAGAAGTLGVALYQSARQTDEFENALDITNNALGVTAGQLEELADRIGDQTRNASAARQAIVQMVRDGTDSMGELALAAESVARRNEATGESVDDLVDAYREIANDPVQALTDLDEQYHFLTEDTIRQITKLQEQGREQAAVRFAMEEWASASDEASRKVIENMNAVDRSLKEIANTFGGVFSGIADTFEGAVSANLGRHGQGSDEDRIAYLQQRLAEPEYSERGRFADRSLSSDRRRELEDELRMLQQMAKFRQAAEVVSGSLARQNSEEAQALASLNRERENYLTQDRELQKQLEEHTRQREAFRQQFEETGDEKWLRAMEGAEEKIAAVRDELNGAAEAQRRQEKAQREAAREAERQAKAQQQVLDTLYPLQAAQRRFREEMELLNLRAKTDETLDLADAQERLRTQYSAEITGGFMEQVASGGIAEGLDRSSEAAERFGLTFSSALEDAIVNFEDLGDVAAGFFTDLQRMIVRTQITEPLGKTIGGFDWGGMIGSFFGGGGGATVDTSGVAALGFNTGQFASGGYTGDGGKHDPAGIVHRGEFVVQKGVVERPGVLPMLERLNKGYADGGYVGGSASATPASPPSITIHSPITVQAQPGTSNEDARRQGAEAGKAFKAVVLSTIREQQRPGGLLYGGKS